MQCGPISWCSKIHWLHLCRGVRLPKRISRGPLRWGSRIHRLHLYRGVRLHNWISRGPSSWGCRIHRLLLCRGVRSPTNDNPWYDAKQPDGEVPVILELCGMRRTLLLPSLLGPLWPEVIAPDRFGLVSLFNCITTFVGYLMPKPFSKKNSVVLFNP